ncbi:MAG: UbiX family flavin prenyltransferase [Alphaproteobacteria bacterium]|nr:UbiX family flavin prenyltransferase [Alphaproteobacteria bacterium]
MSEYTRRLVIGITGASGVIYGVRLLQALREASVETHLVVSRAGQMTLAHEEPQLKLTDLAALANYVYSDQDIGAAISSGSFRTNGMIIAPCSVQTLSAIATGVTTNLVARAADVILKERRMLVLLVRETPLHLGHLRAMTAVTEMGAIVYPPVPAFYSRPVQIDDLVSHTVGRVLDLFDIETRMVTRWRGMREKGSPAPSESDKAGVIAVSAGTPVKPHGRQKS